MISDQIYKGIGFFVAIMAFIFVIVRIMKFQAKTLEGFTDEDKSKPTTPVDSPARDNTQNDKQITDNVDKTNKYRQTSINNFQVDKYKEKYDDILYNMYKSTQVKMLNYIINNADTITTSAPDDAGAKTIMTNINNLNTFLTTLNSASDILGKMK
jgi:hypothetical protein